MKMDKRKGCKGEIEIYDNGDFKVRKFESGAKCKAIIKKINPVRGTFWKNHMDSEEKKKLKLDDE